MIAYSSQQVEAQTKASAPVAVTLAQDAKHLESRQSVFDHHAFAGQLLIGRLLLCCERMMLALFVRRLAIDMPVVETSVASIGHTAAGGFEPQAAVLEKSKVMNASRTKSRR